MIEELYDEFWEFIDNDNKQFLKHIQQDSRRTSS